MNSHQQIFFSGVCSPCGSARIDSPYVKINLPFANPKFLAHLQRFDTGTLPTIGALAKLQRLAYALLNRRQRALSETVLHFGIIITHLITCAFYEPKKYFEIYISKLLEI